MSIFPILSKADQSCLKNQEKTALLTECSKVFLELRNINDLFAYLDDPYLLTNQLSTRYKAIAYNSIVSYRVKTYRGR
jgi:hypothetical protein